MGELFIRLVNMSVTASYLALAVMAARLLLKKAPKWVPVALWALVGLRLILPISIESGFSLVPGTQPVPSNIMSSPLPQINTGIQAVNSAVNPILGSTMAPQPGDSVNPMQVLMFAAGVIWLIGMAAMAVYALVSYLRLRYRVREAVQWEGRVYQCDRIPSPFILGLMAPRIYLPSGMAQTDIAYVIAHEKAHLMRLDHIWKPLGFALLTVYWFNPIFWISYVLLCRDIESACDERVLKTQGPQIKQDYCTALLNCSVSRRSISACPLAFGEVGVRQRIRNVLSYKRPAFWVLAAALVLCLVVGLCFLTNPHSTQIPARLEYQICQWIEEANRSEQTQGHFVTVNHEIIGTKRSRGKITVYLWVYYGEYSYDGQIHKEAASHMLTAITAEELEGDRYRLVEYWNPEDGAGYAASVRKKLPWYLHRQGLDSEATAQSLQELGWAKAQQHYLGLYTPNHTEGGDYLGLDASEGLTVYVYLMAQNSYRCLLLPGYGTELTLEEGATMTPTGLEQMRDILKSYQLPSDQVLVVPYQMIYSSYITPTDAEFVQFLRYSLGLDAQLETRLPSIKGYHISYSLQVLGAGWLDSWDIYRSAINARAYSDRTDFSNMLAIHPIHSAQELKRFQAQYREKLALDWQNDDCSSFSQGVAQFDEDFFRDSSLILIFVRPGKNTERFQVQDVQYTTDKALHFEVIKYKAEGSGEPDNGGYFLCVGIDKRFAADCETYSARFWNG